MTIHMNDSHITSIAQLRDVGEVARGIEFQGTSRAETYAWISEVLQRFRYFSCRKRERGAVKAYLGRMTGYSDAQLTRLIGKKKVSGRIVADTSARHSFPVLYTTDDVALLATTDLAHSRLSGPATKEIFAREYGVFGQQEFGRLKDISVSHLYRLRGRRQYTSATKFFSKTNPTTAAIGERRKPDPQGKPGFLRVDTVHQGDKGGEKGVYHINTVDAVLQWEVVGAVEKISEAYLAPLLADLLDQYPYVIRGFHSDNGSEYINRVVAKLLNKLLVDQTKSRPRRCNDNALVEGKNGAVIRKHLGYQHIAQRYASPINAFYRQHFNGYLNYHRPCGFATTRVDEKGKEKKVYDIYETPYVRLRSISGVAQYLKAGVTIEMLETIALTESDNECAKRMQQAKQELFKTFSAGSPHLGLIA